MNVSGIGDDEIIIYCRSYTYDIKGETREGRRLMALLHKMEIILVLYAAAQASKAVHSPQKQGT